MKPKRILLVEDSVQDMEMMLHALRLHRVANEVVTLRDGVEALDYLYRREQFAERKDEDPAVILLDLKMPRMDGLDVLRQLKTDPKLRVIPIVVLTSSRQEQDVVNSYHLGVNAYVVKPMEYGSFVDAVKTVGAFWSVLNELPQGLSS